MPPGSSPPCPAEIATMILRRSSLRTALVEFEDTVLVFLGTSADSDSSYRSTTRRSPCSLFGARVKLRGSTSTTRSITIRSVSPSRIALRIPLIGLSLKSSLDRSPTKDEPSISITTRAGLSSVNSLYSTSPDRSNTRRVWSGARHTLTSSTSAADTAKLASSEQTARARVRQQLLPLILLRLCCDFMTISLRHTSRCLLQRPQGHNLLAIMAPFSVRP